MTTTEEGSEGSGCGRMSKRSRWDGSQWFVEMMVTIEPDLTCRLQSQRPVGGKSQTDWDWSSGPKTTSPPGSWAMTALTHMKMFPSRPAGTLASNKLRRTFAGHTPGNSLETNSSPSLGGVFDSVFGGELLE